MYINHDNSIGNYLAQHAGDEAGRSCIVAQAAQTAGHSHGLWTCDFCPWLVVATNLWHVQGEMLELVSGCQHDQQGLQQFPLQACRMVLYPSAGERHDVHALHAGHAELEADQADGERHVHAEHAGPEGD